MWLFLNVRPKKGGSYTPVFRDCNQIQRIPTTGLGGSYAKTVYLRNRKLTCNHFLESLNGMSVSKCQRKLPRWESESLFMLNKRFYTTRYCYNYLRLLLYSYYDSITGRPLLGPPSWAPSWASLGITVHGRT